MAYYSFKDKETGEEFDLEMPISERDQFLADNPNVIQLIRSINFGDSARLGIKKPPADFSKYVLGKVKAANPLAPAMERRFNIQKEV